MKKIILASASPRRQELLRQIGLSFEVHASNVSEEEAEGEPREIAQNLARQKAAVAADRLKEGIVIGADTLVVIDNIVLGKPSSAEEAEKMLKILSGRWHQVVTGLCLIDAWSGKEINTYEITRVKFFEISENEIKGYISTGEPLDKAGAYGIQGLGAVLVESIEGSYSNVVGLPLGKLARVLKDFGVNVMGKN